MSIFDFLKPKPPGIFDYAEHVLTAFRQHIAACEKKDISPWTPIEPTLMELDPDAARLAIIKEIETIEACISAKEKTLADSCIGEQEALYKDYKEAEASVAMAEIASTPALTEQKTLKTKQHELWQSFSPSQQQDALQLAQLDLDLAVSTSRLSYIERTMALNEAKGMAGEEPHAMPRYAMTVTLPKSIVNPGDTETGLLLEAAAIELGVDAFPQRNLSEKHNYVSPYEKGMCIDYAGENRFILSTTIPEQIDIAALSGALSRVKNRIQSGNWQLVNEGRANEGYMLPIRPPHHSRTNSFPDAVYIGLLEYCMNLHGEGTVETIFRIPDGDHYLETDDVADAYRFMLDHPDQQQDMRAYVMLKDKAAAESILQQLGVKGFAAKGR